MQSTARFVAQNPGRGMDWALRGLRLGCTKSHGPPMPSCPQNRLHNAESKAASNSMSGCLMNSMEVVGVLRTSTHLGTKHHCFVTRGGCTNNHYCGGDGDLIIEFPNAE